MKKVLITGFEPFGGHALNPSQLIAERLDGQIIAKHQVIGATLACEFGKSIRQLDTLLKETRPELVVCLGLADNRMEITPERVAINIEEARIADNAGCQPNGKAVIRGGPVGYWSTLPINAIVAALRERGYPASISQTAGTFVCNHVFYGLMHKLSGFQRRVRGGFIHVPLLAEGSATNSGSTLGQLTQAIAIAVETSLRMRKDIRSVEGAVC